MDVVCRGPSFQDLIFLLQKFWSRYGCVVLQPYDAQVGAGTFHPATPFYALGPRPWSVAFVQPSRRPQDGRYGNNPNRVQRHYQFQVILKPAPQNPHDLLIKSLESVGLNGRVDDIRFVEDDWESPTLGASGVGWEVWCNGMEIVQFTYFQQIGGMPCRPVCVEFTYGLERLAMNLQETTDIYRIRWNNPPSHNSPDGFFEKSCTGSSPTNDFVENISPDTGSSPDGSCIAAPPFVTYGDISHQQEVEFSHYNFSAAPLDFLYKEFEGVEKNGHLLVEKNLILPAYDMCIQASHTFNLLDARGALSPAQRASYIQRVRHLAQKCFRAWVQNHCAPEAENG